MTFLFLLALPVHSKFSLAMYSFSGLGSRCREGVFSFPSQKYDLLIIKIYFETIQEIHENRLASPNLLAATTVLVWVLLGFLGGTYKHIDVF